MFGCDTNNVSSRDFISADVVTSAFSMNFLVLQIANGCQMIWAYELCNKLSHPDYTV